MMETETKIAPQTINELLALREHYEKISNTYKGGCINQIQAKAKKMISVLDEKIDKYVENI